MTINGLALIGSLALGKFMYDHDFILLHFLIDPTGPSKAANKTIRFAGWTAISGVLLYLIYF